MTGPAFSWNLIADLREMWSFPFMLNAFRAGTVVAGLAGPVGWFMVLRRQTFAGHTLGLVGFPGAAAAIWLGLAASAGYFVAAVLAALVLAARSPAGRFPGGESAAVGTVQAFALAAGMVFVGLYGGFLGGATALLFGSFLAISATQVGFLVAVAGLALGGLAVIGRPLLFASVDPAVAAAHRVPVRALGRAYLILLGLTTAAVSQLTGALLVFALLVLPAATAHQLVRRPAAGLALATALGLLSVWIALFVGYYSPYPIGFWLTTTAFAGYLAAIGARTVRLRSR